MKKSRILAFSIFILFLLLAKTALGQTPSPTNITFDNPFGNVTFDEMLMRVLRWLWPISIVIAVLMVIIGGYYFVFSGGDPQKAATGRKVIIYTLIGLAIITLARGIVALIRTIIGV